LCEGTTKASRDERMDDPYSCMVHTRGSIMGLESPRFSRAELGAKDNPSYIFCSNRLSSFKALIKIEDPHMHACILLGKLLISKLSWPMAPIGPTNPLSHQGLR